MKDILEIIYKESEELKSSIEFIELISDEQASGSGFLFEHLVKKFVNVKVKMYQEHHGLPHVHLDIGNQNHSASIGIEKMTILAGSIDKKYEKVVFKWINKNKENLLIIWNNINQGQVIDLSILN